MTISNTTKGYIQVHKQNPKTTSPHNNSNHIHKKIQNIPRQRHNKKNAFFYPSYHAKSTPNSAESEPQKKQNKNIIDKETKRRSTSRPRRTQNQHLMRTNEKEKTLRINKYAETRQAANENFKLKRFRREKVCRERERERGAWVGEDWRQIFEEKIQK